MASSTYTGDYSRPGKSGSSETMADKASEAAGRVAGAVEEGAKGAGDKASDIATKVADIYSAVDDSVKSQPMATLAAAAGIGFVLGALWKS